MSIELQLHISKCYDLLILIFVFLHEKKKQRSIQLFV